MKRDRVLETNTGIQSEPTVADFNVMQRGFRDKGLLSTVRILGEGIASGHALEIGPGPGYLGLEWLKSTDNTTLSAVEISPAMIAQAEKNCSEYGMGQRASYIEGSALDIPLNNDSVDSVFSTGSLHEWENPYTVLCEAYRVLKPGGKLFIGDLKRNLSLLITGIMSLSVKEGSMKKGFMTSLRASYIRSELLRLCEWSPFENYQVRESPFGLELCAEKSIRR